MEFLVSALVYSHFPPFRMRLILDWRIGGLADWRCGCIVPKMARIERTAEEREWPTSAFVDKNDNDIPELCSHWSAHHCASNLCSAADGQKKMTHLNRFGLCDLCAIQYRWQTRTMIIEIYWRDARNQFDCMFWLLALLNSFPTARRPAGPPFSVSGRR